MSFRQGFFLALALLSGGCGGTSGVTDLQGSGATFPAPLYKRWFLELYTSDPTMRVNYQAIGSGAGIRQFREGLTDLGATDAPMSDKDVHAFLKARSDDEGVLQLPMTAGAVSLCYNLPLPEGKTLRLSNAALVGIILGDITEWNDPALAKLNPGVELPDKSITWVRRSESSGTTFAFTSHLAASSKEWFKRASEKGEKSVDWDKFRPNLGAKGNNGVAALISQTPGALGYIEYGFADLAGLRMAAIENKSGKFVEPRPKSNAAGLKGAGGKDGFRLEAFNPPEADAYPIVTYTWMLARKNYADAEKAEAVRRVLEFCIGEGQEFSEQLGYIKLPDDVRARVRAAIKTIR